MRNNEQTGPFTLEQLRFQKIHPNDIVWVQGQSDSWIYAEQIEELKPLIEPATGEMGQVPSKSLSEFPPFDNNSARSSKQPYADSLVKPGKTKFYQFALTASSLAVVFLAVCL